MEFIQVVGCPRHCLLRRRRLQDELGNNFVRYALDS